ncbi:hypothetical protein C8F04DRAFT_1176992 [Mycena alexandri]|uniref:Uncharacterized protein n=1 Tax=Mycena alexandri TaxID=1745969 RepID=A0AAD6TBU0_9AGAR|nr:hypothetical protein C8F04DRAFT_1176992 [Mycena alexandri]
MHLEVPPPASWCHRVPANGPFRILGSPGGPLSDICPSITNKYYLVYVTDEIKTFQNSGRSAAVNACITYRDEFLGRFLFPRDAPKLTPLSLISPHHFIRIRGRMNTVDYVDAQELQMTVPDSVGVPKRLSKRESKGSAPVYRARQLCEGCRAPERDDTCRFSVKFCNEKMSRKVYYCSRLAEPQANMREGTYIQTHPENNCPYGRVASEHSFSPGKARASAKAIHTFPGSSPADPISKLRSLVRFRMCVLLRLRSAGHVDPRTCYANGFRLTCRTAMDTGDPVCITALCENLIPMYPMVRRQFADQLIAEYGTVAVAAVKAAQTKLDLDLPNRFLSGPKNS